MGLAFCLFIGVLAHVLLAEALPQGVQPAPGPVVSPPPVVDTSRRPRLVWLVDLGAESLRASPPAAGASGRPVGVSVPGAAYVFTLGPDGQVAEVRCTYDPATVGGDSGGRAVKGTIHWVSAAHAVEAEVRLYETLFATPKPDDEEDFKAALNPNSLSVLSGARLEPALGSAAPGSRFQFERNGYFCVDSRDSAPGRPVFNRTVGLRDTWAKIEKAG